MTHILYRGTGPHYIEDYALIWRNKLTYYNEEHTLAIESYGGAHILYKYRGTDSHYRRLCLHMEEQAHILYRGTDMPSYGATRSHTNHSMDTSQQHYEARGG